ncbi:sigma-70 family RNA polymerase sigma factor [uncultured Rhodoblastus sp.]|uniref:sigma-70 family RNA polymerase sigma factor n=1 Tax=uncultured Rhodoblastus sp. TaxID=543037 RepID=UPI0025EFD432|nr:sigma-70 family RNA polymerase sigma factor [uncultured Rhodoblastus sp.]
MTISTANRDDELAQWLQGAAQGDRQAFAALYRATSPKLYATILRILNDRALAADVLQEVYVKIWRHAATYDAARAAPGTWMTAIARNRALDEARKRKPPTLDAESEELHLAAPEQDPLAGRDRQEELRRLLGCLDGLDAEKRRIVILAYCHGLSREDLSARFDHPTATIKTWLRRSLAQLRECLGS